MEKTFEPAGRPRVPDGTPAEIAAAIGWEAREPVPVERADLGHPFVLSDPATTPPHRLVVLGDSISHGFKSFAIAETELSWPALVAHAAEMTFRYPEYPGPADCPGLPLNLEATVRHLQKAIPGSALNIAGDLVVGVKLRSLMDDVEDYWERGDGARLVEEAPNGTRNHNLAIWGWDLRDALSRTVDKLQQTLAATPGRDRDNAFQQIPSAAGERSALLTLSGGAADDTPISLARRFGNEGVDGQPGIETLVVALGANNILGTILNFNVVWTEEGDDPEHPLYRDLDQKSRFNAWTPSHFAMEFDELMAAVRSIKARHIIVFTVPHVTIAPMVRGVGDKMPGDRYFARYTRPWIGDDHFNANRDPCLSGDVLRVLDFAVDQYNDHIVRTVEEARLEGLDWRVLDIAGILDRLAYRRYMVDEQAQPDWWTPYVLPEAYRTLSPQPDTRFYRSDRFGRLSGGLIALDGVHPTTIGYGIIAREVMHVMKAAGVKMASDEPNFDELIKNDSLIQDPPARIASILDLVEWANKLVDLYRVIGGQPPA